MKNVRFLHWQPTYHWTDQKLKVHAFSCVLVHLLCSLAHKEVRYAGIDISLHTMLKELWATKQLALFYREGAGVKSHVTLSRTPPRQRKIADVLQIQTLVTEADTSRSKFYLTISIHYPLLSIHNPETQARME